MRLRDPSGGAITVERPYLPFTPTEFARARALVELDARLGPRVPRSHDVLTLPEGNEITVRRADGSDQAAARAMHDRCSERTLGLRYHGPVSDADRYLGHLLSPRFGRTLAATTASGKLVALGHLLWDGDETEVALLIEDDWQRRGIGSELLQPAHRDGRGSRVRQRVRRHPGLQHRDGRGHARPRPAPRLPDRGRHPGGDRPAGRHPGARPGPRAGAVRGPARSPVRGPARGAGHAAAPRVAAPPPAAAPATNRPRATAGVRGYGPRDTGRGHGRPDIGPRAVGSRPSQRAESER